MDMPMCDYCCLRPAVDVDHIYGRLGQLLDDPYNLAWLCRECHMARKSKADKYKLAQVVRSKIITDFNY